MFVTKGIRMVLPTIEFKTHPAIRRYEHNPILKAGDVPYNAVLTFNAGITKFHGRYVMVFRCDQGDPPSKKLNDRIVLGLAFSDDGLRWTVEPTPLPFPMAGAYDPRLTVLDGRLYMCFATSGRWGTAGGVAVTDDLKHWDILSISAPDNRNMVIFPERVNGRIVRLERPFAGYLRAGDWFDLFISASPDGRYWGDPRPLLETCQVPWANNKIGPAAPPIRTSKGWLAFFHGVDVAPDRTWGWSRTWNKRYSAGLMLLDTQNPWELIGLSRGPVLVPEAHVPYEREGFRDYVIFPGGMIAEPDGSVKIYYGAADTVEALAFSTVDELLALCEPVK